MQLVIFVGVAGLVNSLAPRGEAQGFAPAIIALVVVFFITVWPWFMFMIFKDIYFAIRRWRGIDPPLPPKPPKPERIRLLDIFRWLRAGMPMPHKSKAARVDAGPAQLLNDGISSPRIARDRGARVIE